MNLNLINQLLEKDLFQPPSKEEVDYREANKPPKVLSGSNLQRMLQMTLVGVIQDLGQDEIIEALFSGDPITTPGISSMDVPRLLKELSEWLPAYKHEKYGGFEAPEQMEQILLALIKDYTGEKYDKIKGLQNG